MADRASLSAVKARTVGWKKISAAKEGKTSNVEAAYVLYVETQAEYFISKTEVGHVTRESAIIRRHHLSKGQFFSD